MSSCMECMPIALLNIELRAPVTTDLVCIAVLEGVRVVIDCGHEDGIEGRDTATANHAQVDIVFHGTTQKVWLVVRICVQTRRRRQIHPVVVAVREA